MLVPDSLPLRARYHQPPPPQQQQSEEHREEDQQRRRKQRGEEVVGPYEMPQQLDLPPAMDGSSAAGIAAATATMGYFSQSGEALPLVGLLGHTVPAPPSPQSLGASITPFSQGPRRKQRRG